MQYRADERHKAANNRTANNRGGKLGPKPAEGWPGGGGRTGHGPIGRGRMTRVAIVDSGTNSKGNKQTSGGRDKGEAIDMI